MDAEDLFSEIPRFLHPRTLPAAKCWVNPDGDEPRNGDRINPETGPVLVTAEVRKRTTPFHPNQEIFPCERPSPSWPWRH